MSLSDRRTILKAALVLGAALSLSACGFTPVYGPEGAGLALRGKVAVQAPDDATSYALVARLQRRLGLTQSPDYRLTYTITTASTSVGVTDEEATTRYQITGQARYSLTDLQGSVVRSGTVSNFTAYSAIGSDVALVTARADANERLMVMLADQIFTGLLGAVTTQ
ncbi:hypothetical protein AQS8620_03248 [Aquimixticola soesokkakensis]|uniref:LPS-assembly lipoprotein n=1 Tax=Aquimixticola soesokkakensis TaxID=1519096 RepID=A0A1Y5TP82_9RHOB|nr:LPS assembly lipoprotein LptE [Aquimixticola soesokkakensis]SLN68703.1 hypothetical protein AQS8620_03248 [Aquimixticola soesokkakensis]